ncbi:unnamed protein product [Mytilus edulis]|uniref:CxC1-like cysteine cluster associated with KDZ transposases domain-containing protein n=1 Tax=Mytilus edulis TaxID=6550 RepID=A0A8S3RSL4_MYTED|nr:unnamed protein product [Mytilus edulis]
MSQNYVKKRKLQYAYVTHVNGRKKTVKKSYKPEEIPCIKESLPSTLPSTPVIEEERIEVSDENININKYAKAKHQRISNWTETYNKLVSYAKEKEAVNTLNCHDCGIRCEDLYRCIDCISWPVICGSCLDLRHQHPHLHVFEKWMHGAFIGYAPPTLPWKGKQHELCTTSYLKEIVVIDDKGRQHLRTIQFCSCEDEAVTLLSYNLWPASPKTPHLAFHMDLLRWLNGLLLECHVSVKGFCEALKARQPKLYKMLVTKEGKEIYKSLMAETIHHFRQYVYQMDYMTDYYPDLDDGCNCPACFEAETSIFCFDADFQLVRKSSSGYNWIAPKHEDRFFVQQKLVDDFIKDYNTPKIEKDCSDFQAGNDIRSKAKNNKLSETAVFGATCRHDFPQKFFSLKHGEKLGYAVFLLELLLKKNSDRQMHISYDIACLLKKHLEKAGRNDLLEKLTFSVPIFHCYGHSISCQILLGPRRTENHGLTDGEGIERLWSYLGGFSTITKEMTPENRTDLLTDGLIYFGQKIRDKIGDTLVMKIKRTAKIEENSDGALQEIISTIPDKVIGNDEISKWIEEEKLSVVQNHNNDTTIVLNKTDDYFLTLQRYNSIGSELLDEKALDTRETLSAFERKHKTSRLPSNAANYLKSIRLVKLKQKKLQLVTVKKHVAERHYLLKLLHKYCKGQAVFNKLSKQMKCVSKKIHKAIDAYNMIGDSSDGLPENISFDSIKDIDSEIYNFMKDFEVVSDIPQSIKQEIIQLKCLKDRCIEEQRFLKQEMISVIKWCKHQYLKVKEKLGECPTSGGTAFLIKEAMYYEMMICRLNNQFSEYIGDMSVDIVFTNGVLADNYEKNATDVEKCSFDGRFDSRRR